MIESTLKHLCLWLITYATDKLYFLYITSLKACCSSKKLFSAVILAVVVFIYLLHIAHVFGWRAERSADSLSSSQNKG